MFALLLYMIVFVVERFAVCCVVRVVVCVVWLFVCLFVIGFGGALMFVVSVRSLLFGLFSVVCFFVMLFDWFELLFVYGLFVLPCASFCLC